MSVFLQEQFFFIIQLQTITHCGLGVKHMPTTVRFLIFQSIFRPNLSDTSQHLCWNSFNIEDRLLFRFTFIGLISWSFCFVFCKDEMEGDAVVIHDRPAAVAPSGSSLHILLILRAWFHSHAADWCDVCLYTVTKQSVKITTVPLIHSGNKSISNIKC